MGKIRQPRKNITGKILEVLFEGMATSADIISAILKSGYGASFSKIDRNYTRLVNQRLAKELDFQERQRFFNLLSKLKREGLVKKRKGGWRITKLGKGRFLKIEEKQARTIARVKYKTEKGNKLNLIIFDIPETDKAKRNWLRDVLLGMGFRMLQKSVWIGRAKIPEEFIDDLRRLKIFKYVHVFSVYKSGTIDLDTLDIEE